jgi:predicted ATPase/DNA-binding CsgD family transcriptional regulator
MDDLEELFRLEPLSLREIEILGLITMGMTNRQIAQELFITLDTVKWHNKQIFGKLHVSSRTKAVYMARRYSLLKTHEEISSLDEDHHHHNLPFKPTSFLGREEELSRIENLLSAARSRTKPEPTYRARLMTLVGPGGVGKSRLAVRSAAAVLRDFPHGAWWLDIAPLSDPKLVPLTLASVLGIKKTGSASLLSVITDYLRERSALLLFDNCEHMVETCAQLSKAIIATCPEVSILITSRQPLGIDEELVMPLAPFPLPGEDLPQLEKLMEYPSVQLFVDRARAAFEAFSFTPENSSAVVEICRQLDGLPLAIELAAARVKMLSVQEIATRLADSFELLKRPGHGLSSRTQTLQASLEWSYSLLDEQERLLLNRLAVFVGGWSLEAAEKICSDGKIQSKEIFDLLSQLVEKSLVFVDLDREKGRRFSFLEIIYRFVLEKLHSSGEHPRLRDRHLEYYLEMSESIATYPLENDRLDWLNLIEIEQNNLRAALDWIELSLAIGGDCSSYYRLVIRLGKFWEWRGYFDEGRDRFSEILSHPEFAGETLERAWLLYQYGWFATFQSDHLKARESLEQSRKIFIKIGPDARQGEVDVLTGLAVIEIDSGESEVGFEHAREALELSEELDYIDGIILAHHLMGVCLGQLNDFEPAWEHLETAHALKNEFEQPGINLLQNMGELALRQGDFDKSQGYLERSLALSEKAGDKWNMAAALGTRGWIALRRRDFAQMREFLGKSLAVRQEIGDKGGVAWCLEKLGESALLQNSPDKATLILGSAGRLRREANSPVNSADHREYERLQVALRQRIGVEAYDRAWKEGAKQSVGTVIRLALEPSQAGT